MGATSTRVNTIHVAIAVVAIGRIRRVRARSHQVALCSTTFLFVRRSAADRGELLAVRLAPRTRLRRRTQTVQNPLLHQLCRPRLQKAHDRVATRVAVATAARAAIATDFRVFKVRTTQLRRRRQRDCEGRARQPDGVNSRVGRARRAFSCAQCTRHRVQLQDCDPWNTGQGPWIM